MSSLPGPVRDVLARARAREGELVFLTGAGISAESGIPTFRGPEGYWRIGSQNYFPEQLATRSAFARMPDEIWAWYLYRRAVCRAARPNAAHEALVRLEVRLGDRFVIVTQNVDGLRVRAGNSLRRTLEIHGNTDFMRCWEGCSPRRPDALIPMPEALPLDWARDRAVSDAERALLRCPRCRARSRPHVLWFDECYDEELFRAESALFAAERACLLVVIGTAGQTNLPQQIVRRVAGREVPILVVDKEETVFAPYGEATGGAFLRGAATEWVPLIAQALETP